MVHVALHSLRDLDHDHVKIIRQVLQRVPLVFDRELAGFAKALFETGEMRVGDFDRDFLLGPWMMNSPPIICTNGSSAPLLRGGWWPNESVAECMLMKPLPLRMAS